jgi:hypothetical protein
VCVCGCVCEWASSNDEMVEKSMTVHLSAAHSDKRTEVLDSIFFGAFRHSLCRT